MVNISLLLPTRKRQLLVQRLLQSLVETTLQVDQLEVVLYVDVDDPESQQISHPTLSLIKCVGEPGETMGNMNRKCYEASHGRYVLLMNDDAIFRTKGWDTEVMAAFSRFPDSVALVYGNDLDQGKAVPTFPALSRTVCELLEGICPRDYQNLHIESHIFDIFKQLRRLGHNRIAYLDRVVIEHMHHILGKGEADETSIKKNQRADDLLFISLDADRRAQAETLARYIDSQSLETKEPGDKSFAAVGSIQWFKKVVNRLLASSCCL